MPPFAEPSLGSGKTAMERWKERHLAFEEALGPRQACEELISHPRVWAGAGTSPVWSSDGRMAAQWVCWEESREVTGLASDN